MSREPRAVLALLALAVAGHAIRLLLAPSGAPPGELFASNAAAPDPLQQRAQAARAGRPLRAGEILDVNSAPADELARLPGIGMSLAKRIVAERTAKGPFGGLRELDRVPGVGPALLAKLADRVRFGGVRGKAAVGSRDANPLTHMAYGPEASPGPKSPIDLNLASENELRSLPGIGRVRALAVLAYRREKGPFALVSDLERVPGFTRGLVGRLTPLVTVH